MHSAARGVFKPELVNGIIRGTPLVYELQLKIGARVMLTTNLDVCDGLVNGSIGTVAGFEYKRGGGVRYVMVEFDDPKDGRNRRLSLSEDIKRKYPGKIVTHIEMLEVNFSQGRDRDYASVGGLACNFPLRLCFAATGHKLQGVTVKDPTPLIVDMHCYLQSAAVYVMLSRVQCLNQLYVLESVLYKKVKPFPQACEEFERLARRDISISRVPTDPNITEIVSLNVSSLKKHFSDLSANQILCKNHVICVQETWFEENDEVDQSYQLPSKLEMFVSAGRGKGVGVYFHPNFSQSYSVQKPCYQMAAVSCEDLVVINLYRSSNANTEELIDDFLTLIQHYGIEQTLILCGDFNFCEREDKLHPFRKMLKDKKFESLLNPPDATHQEGRCLDQAYLRIGFGSDNYYLASAEVGTCSFSDHDSVLVTAHNVAK